MIPTFPKFKKISVADRSEVSHFLPKKPYSDYNFTNLWCWDIQKERKISLCNGNLVVLFTDYVTNELCLSFCGTKKPVSTAQTLLTYAEQQKISPTLKYVPASTAHSLKSKRMKVNTDQENFDYIFSTAQIALAKGSRFKQKRKLANRFIREHAGAVFTIADLADPTVQKQVLSTLARWHRKKKKTSKKEYDYETTALKRLLSEHHKHSVVLSAIYKGDTMLAFSIDEILPNRYAISHFLKADTNFIGVYEYLNQKTAQYLKKKGVAYWNWEQDLNIEGLRNLKMSYRPIRFLKKYRVALVE